MKLYKVDYCDDTDFDSYLTVGNSEEEVKEREVDKLANELSCFMGIWLTEINEVGGYNISLTK